MTDDPRQPPRYLAVGEVLRPHGIRGALLIQSDTDLILTLAPGSKVYFGASERPQTVKRFHPHRKHYLLITEELNSRNEADKFRGEVVNIQFEDADPLPEGVYYQWQIKGMRVFTEGGDFLGTLEQIIVTGANDVYLVRNEKGDEILLPAIKSVIKSIDLQSERMTVHLIPGLI